MKKRVIWMVIACLLSASLLLASCNTTTSNTTTQTATSTKTTTTTVSSTTTSAAAITVATGKTTTAGTGNWWDSLGKPQYGGEMVLQSNKNFTNFDPYNDQSLSSIMPGYMEKPFCDDWTLDPSVFNYQMGFRPDQFQKGYLAQSWEFTSPGVLTLKIRKGISWQNIAPAYGREFIADDIAFHFNRMFGLGEYGFTTPAPYWGANTSWSGLKAVSATDKYTVVFKWSVTNPEYILETLEGNGGPVIENPEAVKLWGRLDDWHHAIGTGPFILQDFVSSASATLVRNPNYWGYDERYPQNKLPYVDSIKYLIIPDAATTLAAIRTGKVDMLNDLSIQQADAVKKTNPEIVRIGVPTGTTTALLPRNDKAPFTDINVRIALQMAIDLPTIAKTYYNGTVSPNPSSLTSNDMTGWGFPYKDWPQELKDQYAYNPTKAKQLLSAAGFPNGFKTDIVADSSSDIDILQIVKSYYDQIGVNMEIRTMDTAAFTTFVRTNHAQDQMSTKGQLGVNYEPLRQLSLYVTNYPANYAMNSDPVFDAFAPAGMAATSVDQVKQILKDANDRVARQHYAVSLLAPVGFNLIQPWLNGYDGQFGSVAGSIGPAMLAFYGARFWINADLKKSMGH